MFGKLFNGSGAFGSLQEIGNRRDSLEREVIALEAEVLEKTQELLRKTAELEELQDMQARMNNTAIALAQIPERL